MTELTPVTATDAAVADTANGSRLLLATVLLAVIAVPTAISGTAVALPSIGIDTGASLAALQWVVNAFNLSFACFTLAWGALADIVGRKPAFALGAAIYAAASVVSATAGDIVALDIARGVAGLGAAAIFSCGSAMLSAAFTGPARLRAFALFGTVAGIGVGAGPTISGLLTGQFGWRSIFLLHAATLGLAVVGTLLLRREPRPGHGGRIDGSGTVLFVGAMALIMVGIVQGPQSGWTSAPVLALFAAGLATFVAFVVVERRRVHPMLDLTVLRDRLFVGYCLIPVVASFGFVTLLTYFPTYLTAAAGWPVQSAGFAMVLLTMPVFFCPPLAGRLAQGVLKPRTLLIASLACLVIGDTALTLIGPTVSLPLVALPMLLVGAGMGLSAGLVDGEAISAVRPEQAGMAAGVLNTLRLGSEAIAVAIYGAVLASLMRAGLPGRLTPLGIVAERIDVVANATAAGDTASVLALVAAERRPALNQILIAAYDGAFHQMLWILAAICLGLSLIIVWLLRDRVKASPSQ